METKKSEKASLENRRKFFFQIGIVCGLSVALLGFEWTQFELIEHVYAGPVVEADESEMIPITVRKVPKVELPDVVDSKSKQLKVVDDIVKDVADPVVDPSDNEDDLNLNMEGLDGDDGDDEPLPNEPPIFVIVEDMPEFMGGEAEMYKYLAKHIKYPAIAKDQGVQGIVYLTFVVNEDGSISNVKTLRGEGFGLDEEATRVVNSMPNWKPGMQRGKKVKVQFNLPIRFKLQ